METRLNYRIHLLLQLQGIFLEINKWSAPLINKPINTSLRVFLHGGAVKSWIKDVLKNLCHLFFFLIELKVTFKTDFRDMIK